MILFQYLVLQILIGSHQDKSRYFTSALQAVRTLLLLLFCIWGLGFSLYDRSKSAHDDGEISPLLGNGMNGHAKQPARDATYGSVDSTDDDDPNKSGSDDDADIESDSEEPERDKEIKRQQKKRLEESGSWLNYFSDFKVFIPLLWPSRNRIVQACLALVIVVLLAQRVLNILVPRQLGKITDDLSRLAGTGEVPWHNVGLWIFYSTLSSQAGLSLAKSLAEIPIQQYAYKSIGKASFEHVMGLSMVSQQYSQAP